jgi:hypothetical protein
MTLIEHKRGWVAGVEIKVARRSWGSRLWRRITGRDRLLRRTMTIVLRDRLEGR